MSADRGFFSRWSQRKTQVREGLTPQEPAPAASAVATPESTPAVAAQAESTPAPEQVRETPLPTLADAQQLTPDSDFTGFMARGVTPDVKNAAMKKLFTDPHFNVMDRMDVYIDDYTQPDPLPMAVLRQMTSVDALNLFDSAPQDPSVAADSAPSEPTLSEQPHAKTDDA